MYLIGADGAIPVLLRKSMLGLCATPSKSVFACPEKMACIANDLAEMYVGDDTDFTPGSPKYDHVAVGTGTMQVNKASIKQLRRYPRPCCQKTSWCQTIKVEAHLIPEHPRPRRVVGRVALQGDAAGCYQSSGEGIYFAKSARMCAERFVEVSMEEPIPTEADLNLKRWDKSTATPGHPPNCLLSHRRHPRSLVEMCST